MDIKVTCNISQEIKTNLIRGKISLMPGSENVFYVLI